MTISLGRLIFIVIMLSILAIGTIFAMDMLSGLNDLGQQYAAPRS